MKRTLLYLLVSILCVCALRADKLIAIVENASNTVVKQRRVADDFVAPPKFSIEGTHRIVEVVASPKPTDDPEVFDITPTNVLSATTLTRNWIVTRLPNAVVRDNIDAESHRRINAVVTPVLEHRLLSIQSDILWRLVNSQQATSAQTNQLGIARQTLTWRQATLDFATDLKANAASITTIAGAAWPTPP